MGPVTRACLRHAHCPIVIVAAHDQLAVYSFPRTRRSAGDGPPSRSSAGVTAASCRGRDPRAPYQPPTLTSRRRACHRALSADRRGLHGMPRGASVLMVAVCSEVIAAAYSEPVTRRPSAPHVSASLRLCRTPRPCSPGPLWRSWTVKSSECASGLALLIRLVPPGTGQGPILPCSLKWPSGWSCACSVRVTAGRRGLSSPRWTVSSGTATCRASARAGTTGIACTARTRRAAVTGAMRRSCCSTRTARPSRARCAGTRPCSPSRPARRRRSALATAPRSCRAMS